MNAPPTDILLDANLLVVLIVGHFDPRLIGRKCLDSFSLDDFEMLRSLVGRYRGNRTTPHLLAEVSNLADQCVPKTRHREFRLFFSQLIQYFDERWMPAAELAQTDEFRALGLADAAVSQLVDEHTFVLSVDMELCSVLGGHGVNAENFNHLRDS